MIDTQRIIPIVQEDSASLKTPTHGSAHAGLSFDVVAAYRRQLLDDDVCNFSRLVNLNLIQCSLSITIIVQTYRLLYVDYRGVRFDELTRGCQMPIAAVLALTELIAHSRGTYVLLDDRLILLITTTPAETMYELVEELKNGAGALKRHTPNPISLSAGADLFIRYVTTAPQEHTVSLNTHTSRKESYWCFPGIRRPEGKSCEGRLRLRAQSPLQLS